jgi:hypothetical protein
VFLIGSEDHDRARLLPPRAEGEPEATGSGTDLVEEVKDGVQVAARLVEMALPGGTG